MIRDEKIEVELIDDSIDLNIDLECNTQTIEVEFNDSNYSEIKQEIADLQNNKVDKIEGKGLSTNDFTNEYKNDVEENTSARHTHNNKSVIDTITNEDIENWNNKSDFSGDYNDLTNKPDLSEFITKDVDNLTNYTTTGDMNTAISNAVGTETTNRQNADNNLQGQIDAITVSSDVVDIVSTYQDLLDYDTSSLTQDDVIKVLQDSTHNDALSYYRWVSNSWEYLGSEGPFYTKSEADTLLNNKQNTIDSSHKLSSDLVDDTGHTNKFVTSQEKQTWNNKSDFSGNYNDLTNKPDLTLKEDKANKVTSIDENSTDEQYPSAKCVYNSQAIQDEHIDRVESLSNLFDDKTGIGTDITINDTSDTMLKLGLSGNTYQFSTTGKNLLSVQFVQYDTNNLRSEIPNFKAGTYTFSFNGNLSATWQVTARKIVNGTTTQIKAAYNTYTLAFDLDEDATLQLEVYRSGLLLNDISKTMLESGSTATDYEPYTGGQASPSPDYPQDIEVVTGDNEIVVYGKNLLPYPYKDTTKTVDGITFTDNGDGTITANGTATADANFILRQSTEQLSQFKENEQYILSGCTNNDPSVNYNNAPYYIENAWMGVRNYNTSGTTFTYSGINYIRDFRIVIKNGQTVNNLVFKPMVQKGTTATTYEPYKSQVYPINLGVENLIDVEDNVVSLNNVYLTEFNIGLTITNEMIGKRFSVSFDSIISNLSTTSSYMQCAIGYGTSWIEAAIKTTNYGAVANGNYHIKIEDFEFPSNSVGKKVFLRPIGLGTASSCSCAYSNVQLEKGSKANSYTPYGTKPIEMCEIGDYADDFREIDGTWYKHAEIGKVVLDGSEGDWFTTSMAYLKSYSLFINNMKPNTSTTTLTNCLCSHFIESTPDQLWVKSSGNGFSIVQSYGYLRITVGDTTDELQAFKTWLGTHNITLYYVLTTPTNTEITDTTLINQLNALKNAMSYQDQTNIIQTNDEQPFIIDYETYAKVPTKLSELTNDAGYVKNTDYATLSKGGVIKPGSNFEVNSSEGYPYAAIRSYAQYSNDGNSTFIGKGTLENVITGKGLVSDTDYATSQKGGVVKGNTNGFNVSSTGTPSANIYTYNQYQNLENYNFIGKGTLENVITGKGLLDSSKVKTSTDTTAGNVYDVTYINTMLGNIESLLSEV